MCELSTKLIAWLDGELPDTEAAELEQHMHACRECRGCLDRYKNVSEMVGAYCDATLAAKEPKRTAPNWTPVLAAGACLALLFAVFVRSRIERSPTPASASTATAASMSGVSRSPKTASAAVAPAFAEHKAHPVRTRNQRKPTVVAKSRPQNGNGETASLPLGPAIEIAIPGDDVLPPGALPPGIGFIAEVSIGSDGSAQRLQLHPQLTGFERGPNQ